MNEIISRILSFGISGVNGYPVHVEVFGINGLPGIEIIGLPDTSVRESKEKHLVVYVKNFERPILPPNARRKFGI